MFILGASTLGEIVIEVAIRSKYKIEGFYDEINTSKFCGGLPILGKLNDLIENPIAYVSGVFIAIGDNKNRRVISEQLLERGVPLCNIIDSSATIESSASLGSGNLVMSGAYIGVRTTIGTGNLIFPGVSITHHNSVGSFCFFSPNSSVGGFTHIEDECKIAMNSVVPPYVRIIFGSESQPGSIITGTHLS